MQKDKPTTPSLKDEFLRLFQAYKQLQQPERETTQLQNEIETNNSLISTVKGFINELTERHDELNKKLQETQESIATKEKETQQQETAISNIEQRIGRFQTAISKIESKLQDDEISRFVPDNMKKSATPQQANAAITTINQTIQTTDQNIEATQRSINEYVDTLQQQYPVTGGWIAFIDTYNNNRRSTDPKDYFEFYKERMATPFERTLFSLQSFLQGIFKRLGFRTREQRIQESIQTIDSLQTTIGSLQTQKKERADYERIRGLITEAVSNWNENNKARETLEQQIQEKKLQKSKLSTEIKQLREQQDQNQQRLGVIQDNLTSQKTQLESLMTEKTTLQTTLKSKESERKKLAAQRTEKRQELLSFMQNHMTITPTIWQPSPSRFRFRFRFPKTQGNEETKQLKADLDKRKQSLIKAIRDNQTTMDGVDVENYINELNDNPTKPPENAHEQIKKTYEAYIPLFLQLKTMDSTESTVYDTPEAVLQMLLQEEDSKLSKFTSQIERSLNTQLSSQSSRTTSGPAAGSSTSSRFGLSGLQIPWKKPPKGLSKAVQEVEAAVDAVKTPKSNPYESFEKIFMKTCALIFNNKDAVDYDLVTQFQNICHGLTPPKTTIEHLFVTRRTAQRQRELLQLYAHNTPDSSTLEQHGFHINSKQEVIDKFNDNVYAKSTNQGLLLSKLNDDGSWKMETVSGDQKELLSEAERKTIYDFAKSKFQNQLPDNREAFLRLWRTHGKKLCNQLQLTYNTDPISTYERRQWVSLMRHFHPDKQVASPKQAFFSATDPSIQAQCEKVFDAQDTLLTHVAKELSRNPVSVQRINRIHKTLQAGVSPTPSGPSAHR